MRLAVLADDGEVLFEYKAEHVKNELKRMLNTMTFEDAWTSLENKLKNKTGKI